MFVRSLQKTNPLRSDPLEKRRDLIAIIVIFLFFGFVFCCLPFGVGVLDESFYYTIAKRFSEGDRLFTDEWKVVQTFTVFLILPYKLYVSIVGSTEGLILCMRYLYVLTAFVFTLHLYRRLRKYGFIALIYALMLFTVSPVLNFSYYNITINCLALVLVERFSGETPPSRKKLIVLGLIASCAVLAHPVLSIGYFAYTVQVLLLAAIRRKKQNKTKAVSYQPSLHNWAFITIGILIAFSVFAVWFAFSYHFDFRPLFQNLPELFTDPDYSFTASDSNNHFLRMFVKIAPLFMCYGYLPSAAGLLLTAAAFIWRRIGKPEKMRTILFIASCATFFIAYLHLAVVMILNTDRDFSSAFYTLPIVGFTIPIVLFGWICTMLQKKPDPMCIAFLQTSVIASLLIDITSFVCLSYAGMTALFPMLVSFRGLREEMLAQWQNHTNEPTKQESRFATPAARKRLLALVAALLVAPVIGFGIEVTLVYTLQPVYERYDRPKQAWKPMDQILEEGPLKGIRTTSQIADGYRKMMQDMKSVRQLSTGPLYVHYTSPLPYLVADLPIGTHSIFCAEELQMDRELRYWELHPDKIPAVIYMPKYNSTNYFPIEKAVVQNEVSKLLDLFDAEVIEGEAGYILIVDRMIKP